MVVAIPAHSLAYWPVPKAACSTVKAMIARIDPEFEARAQRHDSTDLHVIYPSLRFKYPHFEAQANAYRFTVVRDPIKRLMSVYTNRVLQQHDLIKRRRTMERANMPVEPDPDTFYLNLDAYCRLSTRIHHHVRPCGYFCGQRLDRYARVYRTEEIDQLARDLSAMTGIKVEAVRRNASETTLDFSDLAPATRDSLLPLLRLQYEHLKGYYDNPFD